ncbi:magnesium-translocating P-type ATPase [Streptomyces griseoluteus]|uniref:magnesium-translocating P-type ATPase n=1 Tax=Streptomyces griseoluteus TaxID=29306 RepID=UPI003814B9BD
MPDTSLRLLRRLETGPRGLTETEAAVRLAEHGENTPAAAPPAPSWPRRSVRALRDPFTAVLVTLGLVSAFVASWGTAAVILALVAVSCALRAAGERRADRSLAALRGLVTGTATVLRRAERTDEPRAREVPVADLVPGDIVRLGPGDLVPADVRLLRARGLTVRQDTLTGESAPVAKQAADAPRRSAESPLCFQGSHVVSGSASAVVVATGARTRFGAAQRVPARRGPSAFDRSVHGISWVLVRFMLLTPPLVLMASAAVHGRVLQTLPFAVAAAVGLTPEMLPVIVTTCLARGASRLADAHRVVVRRLPALHDLGAVDVLCLDKTGTLTRDRPVLAAALGPGGRDDPEVLRWAAVAAWWGLTLSELPAPDALDEALLSAAGPVGEEYDGVAALPFDPAHRLATAVVTGALGRHVLITKGAAEAVLERCEVSDTERGRLLGLAERQAESGLRVLAVATAELPARTRPYRAEDARRLTFRGLLTFRDDLAPGAADALRTLTGLGVEVRVLTGDHPATAVRACRDLGLTVGQVRTGGAPEAAGTPGAVTVVARCTAEDKARVVAGLRAAGHTVGFLGDGVNDVPAMLAADVGVAPRGAVDVARESADVVLGEKDLGALGHAVLAGRHSSANIASYLRVTLSSNLGNVLAMLAAGLLLPFLPMLPAQVLAQNLCFDASQLAFADDRPDPEALRRPAKLRPPAFLRFLTGFGLLNAVADLATFAVLLAPRNGAGLRDEALFHSAWFTENLLAQALAMLLLRSGRRIAGGRPGPVGWASAALAGAGLLLPATPLGAVLGLTALPAGRYLLLAAVLVPYALALVVARVRHDRRQP